MILRCSLGRAATALGLALVAVPLAIDSLAGPRRAGCGMTPEANAMTLGLAILVVRAGWTILKLLNDAGERWLRLPNSPIPRRKPDPSDDF